MSSILQKWIILYLRVWRSFHQTGLKMLPSDSSYSITMPIVGYVTHAYWSAHSPCASCSFCNESYKKHTCYLVVVLWEGKKVMTQHLPSPSMRHSCTTKKAHMISNFVFRKTTCIVCISFNARQFIRPGLCFV